LKILRALESNHRKLLIQLILKCYSGGFVSVSPTQIPNTITVAIPSYVLAGLALGVCLVCLYMVFFFGRKLTWQTHMRNTLVEGSVKLESDRCIRQLEDKAYSNPLAPDTNPFPTEARNEGIPHNLWLSSTADKTNYLYLADFYPIKHVDWTYEEHLSRYNLDPNKFTKKNWEEWVDLENKRIDEDNQRRQSDYNDKKIAIEKYLEWEAKERKIFEIKKSEIEANERDKIEKQLPKSMDVSILGTGFSFLLEFSTVIVIIFALIILGIIGLFEGREIAAILAAIAGYVLGKGTRSVTSQKEAKAAETST
jgi:hypothetical protein